MDPIDSLRILRREGPEATTRRIAIALREIEAAQGAGRAEGPPRREGRSIFEITVRAFQEKTIEGRRLCAEHGEVRKVYSVVEASELALTQISLRLQSITR